MFVIALCTACFSRIKINKKLWPSPYFKIWPSTLNALAPALAGGGNLQLIRANLKLFGHSICQFRLKFFVRLPFQAVFVSYGYETDDFLSDFRKVFYFLVKLVNN